MSKTVFLTVLLLAPPLLRSAPAVADESGGCLPDPLPPELAQLLAIQEQVYSAVFATPYDPCRDGGLLLDRPIAGVLDQVTGSNSVGEVFEFLVVEYWRMTEGTREGGGGGPQPGVVPAWFPLSGPVPWPGTAIPPAVADDGAGPAPGEPAAFVAVGRLTTGLGQIGIGALVVLGPDPVNPWYWMTGLIPIWIAPPEVVAVLEEYHSDSRACFDNPCADYGIALDDELKLCLQNAKYAYYTELWKAVETAKGCLLDWSLTWALSTLICIARVFASGPWAVVALLGCVGSITSIGRAIKCLNDFTTEVTNDLHDYNRDVRACCREACYRQGLSNCDQL